MSSFDPNFDNFRSASGYRNRTTDHESKFDAFRSFVLDTNFAGHNDGTADAFVIQFVCHPNFHAGDKTVLYYERTSAEGNDFERTTNLPPGYKRGNSYKNYKSRSGHPKGLFYELNIYTRDGRSNHHTSKTTGSNFDRDATHDQNYGSTKGKHWLE